MEHEGEADVLYVEEVVWESIAVVEGELDTVVIVVLVLNWQVPSNHTYPSRHSQVSGATHLPLRQPRLQLGSQTEESPSTEGTNPSKQLH